MRFYTNVAQWGNSILVREVDNGVRKTYRIPYSPKLYVPTKEKSIYKTLDGGAVAPVEFENIKAAKEFIDMHSEQPGLCVGLNQFQYTFIADKYHGQIQYDKKFLTIFTIDAEVECENGFPDPVKADEPVLSISLKNHSTGITQVWGRGEFHTTRTDVRYKNCRDEATLLESFLQYWEANYPDIVTGWNVDGFDFPYLINRITKILGEEAAKRLSPWKNLKVVTKTFMGQTHTKFDIMGIAVMDYLAMYKKFTYKKQESYRLDYIGEVELGIKKKPNPYDTFKEWYQKDFQSFIEYNIQDIEIVDALDNKVKLIDLILTMAYYAKINFMDVYSPVRMWDIIIYNFLREKNIIIPQSQRNMKSEAFEGAYVKPVQTGLHNWVVSFDLTSLYPHLIMQYNISPETGAGFHYENVTVEKILERSLDLSSLKKENTCMAANGKKFTRQFRGFLAQLMEDMFNKRKQFKKMMLKAKQDYEETKDEKFQALVDMYDMIQMALKIALNSAYGAVGNQGFRYYNLGNAEAVTLSGQAAIQWVLRDINDYMNKLCKTVDKDYVIAADTDSVYIQFDKLIEVMSDGKPMTTQVIVDKISAMCDIFQKKIDKSFADFADYTNAYEQKMIMKREVIADRGLWTGKKRYVLNVHDSEGVRYKEPKMKIMGIEAIKSSTPAACRQKLVEGIKILLFSDEKSMNKFVQDFRNEFMTLPLEAIAFPKSCNSLNEYKDAVSIYKKGTGMHIKGCLVYNFLLKEKNLGYKYPEINSGDKIKYLHLREPNIVKSNVISFKTQFPVETGLAKYIDFEQQFEKAFMNPYRLLVNETSFKLDESFGENATLEDFFA